MSAPQSVDYRRPALQVRAALLLLVGIAWSPWSVADTFSATIDQQKFVATQTIAVRSQIGANSIINVTGHMKLRALASLGFNIVGTQAGHYEIVPSVISKTHGSFNVDVMNPDIMNNVYSFQSGSVDITVLDTKAMLISGTFNAMARNRSGKTVIITNGVFKDISLQ